MIHEVIRNLEGPSRGKAVFSSTATAVVNKFHAVPFGLNFLLKKATLIIALSLLCLGAFIFLTHRYLQQKSTEISEIKSLRSHEVDTPSPSGPNVSQKALPPSPKTSASTPEGSASCSSCRPGQRIYTEENCRRKKRANHLPTDAGILWMVNLTLIDLLLELNPPLPMSI